MKKRDRLALIREFYPKAVTTNDSVEALFDLLESRSDLEPHRIMLADSVCSDDVDTIESPARDSVTDREVGGGTASGEVEAARRAPYHRHFAWLTALRYALREPRAWEAIHLPHNAEYRKRWFTVDEQQRDLRIALLPYLDATEHAAVMSGSNETARILGLQSAQLERLRRRGPIEDFRNMEMARTLGELFDQQGAAERIKNSPYPRQYATLNLWFVRIFVVLVPLGMLQELGKLGGELIWLSIPFGALAGWTFTTMEKVGEGTEYPFEGSANDVPITQMSRMIEIDLRQMLGDADVPSPITSVNGILT